MFIYSFLFEHKESDAHALLYGPGGTSEVVRLATTRMSRRGMLCNVARWLLRALLLYESGPSRRRRAHGLSLGHGKMPGIKGILMKT